MPFLKVARLVLFLAFRQLWGRKLLHGIALCGVALGVLTLIAIQGIMAGFQGKFIDSMMSVSPHLVIVDRQLAAGDRLIERWSGGPVAARIAHQVPSDRPLRIERPGDIVRALGSMGEVEAAAASLPGVVLVQYAGKSKSVELRGIDVAAQERVTPLGPFVTEGRLSRLSAMPDGVVLGASLAKELGASVGDIVHAAAPGGVPLDLRVVALFECGVPAVDRARGYTLLANAQALLGKPDVVGRIEIRLRSPHLAPRLKPRLVALFRHDADTWEEMNGNFLGLFAIQRNLYGFVVGAILLVGGFGILAIQIMIVLEKQRDIAILRSVGLRRSDILSVFLLEGALLAFLGGLLGDLLGKLALLELAKLPVHMEGMVKTERMLIADDPRMYLFGLLFAVSLGVIAALVPAFRASRVEPVDVLRGQLG